MNRVKQRENIISFFEQYPYAHPSAEQIYKYAKDKDQKIGIATVYRHLKKLEEEGIIGALNIEKQGVRYDLLTHEHCHFVCDTCGGIENFDCKVISEANQEVESIVGGKVIKKDIIFHGKCKSCLEKASS